VSLSQIGKKQLALAGKKNDTRITTITQTLQGSAAGGYGGWYEVIASAADDTYVLRLTHHPHSSSGPAVPASYMRALVGLGVGASGSEEQIAEIVLSGSVYINGTGTMLCGSAEINPWFTVAAGTRLAARLSIYGNETQQDVRFSTIEAQYLGET